jgi:hypothetical protein
MVQPAGAEAEGTSSRDHGTAGTRARTRAPRRASKPGAHPAERLAF